MPTFTPPTVLERVDTMEHSMFQLMRINKGMTVLKNGTSYRTVRQPSEADVTNADIAYIGGHTYTITTAEATALTNAGYQVTP